MKKIVNLKEIFIVLIALALITFTTTVFATDVNQLVLGDNPSNTEETPTITPDEYVGAQDITEAGNNTTDEIDNNLGNNTANETENNLGNNTGNNVKKYNTVDKEDEIPQTGIEDYNVGILLIVCVASAIFAYKKINDYRNI